MILSGMCASLLESVVESLFDGICQMAPHELPLTAWLVFVSALTETIRKVHFQNVLILLPAVGMRIGKFSGKKYLKEEGGNRKVLVAHGAEETVVLLPLDFRSRVIALTDRTGEILNLVTVCINKEYFCRGLYEDIPRIDVAHDNVLAVQIVHLFQNGNAELDKILAFPVRMLFLEFGNGTENTCPQFLANGFLHQITDKLAVAVEERDNRKADASVLQFFLGHQQNLFFAAGCDLIFFIEFCHEFRVRFIYGTFTAGCDKFPKIELSELFCFWVHCVDNIKFARNFREREDIIEHVRRVIAGAEDTCGLLREHISNRDSLVGRDDPFPVFTHDLHVVQISLWGDSLYNGGVSMHRMAVIVVKDVYGQSFVLCDKKHAEILAELDVKVQKQVVREGIRLVTENAEISVFVPVQNCQRPDRRCPELWFVWVFKMMDQFFVYSQRYDNAVIVFLKQRNHMFHEQREGFFKHGTCINEDSGSAADKLLKIGFRSDGVFLFLLYNKYSCMFSFHKIWYKIFSEKKRTGSVARLSIFKNKAPPEAGQKSIRAYPNLLPQPVSYRASLAG